MTHFELQTETMRAEISLFPQIELRRRIEKLIDMERGELAETFRSQWRKLLQRDHISPDKLLAFQVSAIHSLTPCTNGAEPTNDERDIEEEVLRTSQPEMVKAALDAALNNRRPFEVDSWRKNHVDPMDVPVIRSAVAQHLLRFRESQKGLAR